MTSHHAADARVVEREYGTRQSPSSKGVTWRAQSCGELEDRRTNTGELKRLMEIYVPFWAVVPFAHISSRFSRFVIMGIEIPPVRAGYASFASL